MPRFVRAAHTPSGRKSTSYRWVAKWLKIRNRSTARDPATAIHNTVRTSAGEDSFECLSHREEGTNRAATTNGAIQSAPTEGSTKYWAGTGYRSAESKGNRNTIRIHG